MNRLLVVAQQRLVAEGLALLIARDGEIAPRFLVGDAPLLAGDLARHCPAQLLIVTPLVALSAEAIVAMRYDHPHLPILLLVPTVDDPLIPEALRAGVRAILLLDMGGRALREAIHSVAAGAHVVAPAIMRRLATVAHEDPPLPEALTAREREVLNALAQGLSNREIAAALSITEGTVKNHISRLLAKLDVRDRTQALIRASELGLI